MFTREQWLASRKTFIGGSDASAVLGRNPYKTNVDVWLEKTGKIVPKDISQKPYVKYGIQAERPLIELFALDQPQYQVTPNTDYKVIRNAKYPFIAATLDAELIEILTNRPGILEIKTTNILQSMQYEKWDHKIPDNYYIQCLHYLLATGWDFTILKAQLKTDYDGDIRLNTRHYHIERVDVLGDLEYLLSEEIRFWNNVLSNTKPNLVLPPI